MSEKSQDSDYAENQGVGIPLQTSGGDLKIILGNDWEEQSHLPLTSRHIQY